MILRKDLLNETSSEIRNAILFLDRKMFIYDVFVLASSEKELESFAKFEKRQGVKISRSNWIKLITEKKGLIFLITSGQFRRKSNKAIEWTISEFKDYLKKYESKKLFFEQVNKHEKFDVFFLGEKEIEKTSENAN